MANDQFNIPVQPNERPLETALRAADAVNATPERYEGYFARIKQIEQRIHSYRNTALDIERRREPGFMESVFGIKRARVALKDLIEEESRVGGELFGPHNRFWLSHKGSSVLANSNELGDWYHVREQFDESGRKIGEVTIHFETHPTHINKLHDGRPVAPTIAELETLVHAIELYEEHVRMQLYPFDQEIYDLLAEIDEENFVVPDTVEEMFGKEIVDRVVAQYKASKGIVDGPTSAIR